MSRPSPRKLSRTGWCVALSMSAVTGAACHDGPEVETFRQPVIVNTERPEAWAQFADNIRFVKTYEPRCAPPDSDAPRLLVTGFGRFGVHADNASGRIVAALLDELEYPSWSAPPETGVDPVADQLAVAQRTVTWPGVGAVELCAMVLPVYWDVAAALVLAEAEAFAPDITVMNGIAGSSQPVWIEMGAINRTSRRPDGSGVVRPFEAGPVVRGADLVAANVGSWEQIRDAATAAIRDETERAGPSGRSLSRIAAGKAQLAGFPRSTNTYLCNNTTFAVNYAFDHPGQYFTLLEASHVPDDYDGRWPWWHDVTLNPDLRERARFFLHWPSSLDHEVHFRAGAQVLRALLTAQLESREPPERGDNALAEVPATDGGDHY
ncbi:MAG: hypothetical protein AAGA56_01845 [Myxococcota bacterium]